MMKLQCSGCDTEEARVFCCADEAALCYGCDEKIHAANKLVSKHHRVPLSSSSPSSSLPMCDICQETFGYFLCLEDRALLCRKCDVAIHQINSMVSSHQRYLVTGVKVGGLESSSKKVVAHCSVSSSTARDSSADYLSKLATSSKNVHVVESLTHGTPENVVACGNAGSNATAEESQIKEILGLLSSDEININNPPGRAALFKGGENSEWWNILRSAEEQVQNHEWIASDNHDISWTVPHLLPPCLPAGSNPPVDVIGRSSSSNKAFSISGAASSCPTGNHENQVVLDDQQNSKSKKRRSHQRPKT